MKKRTHAQIKQDIAEQMKTCSKCGERKSFDDYHNKPTVKDGCHYICKECQQENQNKYYYERCDLGKRKVQVKNLYLTKNYGITLEEYNSMLEEQKHKCKICGCHADDHIAQKGTTMALFVDHDHATGEVRGLLCQQCNTGLGNFKDSITLLKDAIDYLGG